MPQFDRSVSVSIGEEGEQGLLIRNLRISFNVLKTDKKDPNTAEIKIYNMSENTRNQIREKQKLFLNAGYNDDEGESVLFIGDITNVENVNQVPDIITMITVQDGQKVLQNSRISLSYGEKTNAKIILQKIINNMGLASNFNTAPLPNKVYSNGFTFSGLSKIALEKVLDFMELEYSIQNNFLTIAPVDGSTDIQSIFISPQTGMIGSPERFSNDKQKAEGKAKGEVSGWNVVLQMQPRLLPKTKVALQSREIPNITNFTIVTCSHSGDNFEGPWRTEIQVKE